MAWKTFATALALGTQNLEKNKAKFEAEDRAAISNNRHQ